MKRTDMLKLMSKAYGAKNYVYFTEEDADNVLKAMEAAGMLPPKVKVGTYYLREVADYVNDLQSVWEAE